MGRKKKDGPTPDEPLAIIGEPHSVTINAADLSKYMDSTIYEPYTIDTTSLTDTSRSYVYTRPPQTYTISTSDGSSYIVPTYHDYRADARPLDFNEFIRATEGVEAVDMPKMKVNKNKEPQYMGERYRVICNNERDLLPDRILKNLSVIKSKLMIESAPKRIWKIECKMTPAVKQNIVQAYRRNSMFGKKTPFIARFDEYGRRLEDDVQLNTLEGMTIHIVNPEDYGPLYLEFTGLTEEPYGYSCEDLPF